LLNSGNVFVIPPTSLLVFDIVIMKLTEHEHKIYKKVFITNFVGSVRGEMK